MSLSFRSFRLLLPFSALLLLGAGCFGGGTPAGTQLDGGIYRTRNLGVEWKQLRVLNLGTKLASIADVGITSLASDPQDPNALYAGTVENGLLMSLDAGESWMLSKGLSVGRVNAVVVDTKDKCVVFAAKANQIHKTSNCSRDWSQVYFDGRTEVSFTALAMDWFNPQVVYAGSSDGDVFRSDDGGTTWRRSYRIDGTRITGIVVDPRDSRLVYAATDGEGIARTVDSGVTWEKLTKPFENFENARRVKRIVLDPQRKDVVYTVSRYGILQSVDAGANWQPLALPTPPGSVDIKALAVHTKNANVLVYATDASIVWSQDAGKTWSPKVLPTKRGVSALLFDHAQETGLFLGVSPAKK